MLIINSLYFSAEYSSLMIRRLSWPIFCAKDLSEITKQADIIVAAIGISEFLKGDMVKDGVVIIDVGITRVADETKPRGYRLAGDVDFASVSPKASFITPVPGGVGPMTIAMLLKNTLQAREVRS